MPPRPATPPAPPGRQSGAVPRRRGRGSRSSSPACPALKTPALQPRRSPGGASPTFESSRARGASSSDPPRRRRPKARHSPPQGQASVGVSSLPTPRESPTWPHTNPASSKFPPPGFMHSNAAEGLEPLLPQRVSAQLLLPSPRGVPPPLPKEPESLRQFPPPARGRGRSSCSGLSSAVSVRGRCALGTGRRWLAPWLRLLSRRRLLLPVARAAGRSGVLVSDAAEV